MTDNRERGNLLLGSATVGTGTNVPDGGATLGLLVLVATRFRLAQLA